MASSDTHTKATGAFRLMKRDLAVMTSLVHYRELSTSQVERLHFRSRRTANIRLLKLAQHGYFSRYRLPELGPGGTDYIYALTRAGVRLLLDRGLCAPETCWPARPSGARGFLHGQHTLACNDLRIAVELGAKVAHLTLEGYLGEQEMRAVVMAGGNAWSKALRGSGGVGIVPDGGFTLAKEGQRNLFFVEVDLGTAPLTSDKRESLESKFRHYDRILQESRYRIIGQDFKAFRVLVVCPDARRVAQVRELASSLGHAPIFLFTTKEQLGNDCLTRAAWLARELSDVVPHPLVSGLQNHHSRK